MKIVKGRFTGKMWVVNSKGKRITKKYNIVQEEKDSEVFKIIYQRSGIYDSIRTVFDKRTETKFRDIDSLQIVTNDLYAFKSDCKWYFYNVKGELLREDIDWFKNDDSNRLINATIDGKYYYLDYSLKVLSGSFAYASCFDAFEYSVVKQYETGYYGVINTDMEFVIESLECNGITPLSKDYFNIQKGNKYGVIDITGKEVIPCIYTDVWFVCGYFKVKYKGNFGLFDKNGKIVFDCIYPKIIEIPDKFVVQNFAKLEATKIKEVTK